MTFVYIVRCNFTVPEKEDAWNAWYGGPKIVQMLANPHFLSCQRFRRASGIGRDYLALWTMESPDALTTPEYKAQWGFSEWTPLVTDWSRDLFDAETLAALVFAVAPVGGLHVVSFDGMSLDDANSARATLGASSAMTWIPVVGLDRHTPLIGLRPLSKRAAAELSVGDSPPHVQQAVYRPISEFHRSDRLAARIREFGEPWSLPSR